MKRQPGFEVAEKLSGLQRSLNIKTKKMKELAAQINMYQAKVIIFLYRLINLSTILKRPKRKFKRLRENTTSRKRESK